MLKLVLVFILAPCAALAQSQEKKNIMENLASLATANRWCQDYVVDKDASASIALLANLNLKQGPEKSYYQNEMKEYEDVIAKYGVTAFCGAAYKRFGPGGEMSGLMMRK